MASGVVRPFGPPQGVTEALRGHFCPFWPAPSLVLIRGGSCLEHYQVNPLDASLHLLHRATLFGRVHSAAVLPFSSTAAALPAGDRLILGFPGMRVSILRWDPSVFDWRTEEILQMEHFLFHVSGSSDGMLDGAGPGASGMSPSALPLTSNGRLASDDSAVVVADPRGRCVAVVGAETNTVYFAPVRRADGAAAKKDDVRTDLIREAEIFTVDLGTKELGIKHVRHACFLEGYFEPTLLILHQPVRTWVGRAALRNSTYAAVAVGIDVLNRKCNRVWEVRSLPFDSFSVVPVPESAGGGVLVLSTNLLLFLRHGRCLAGLSVNAFGDDFLARAPPHAGFDKVRASDDVVELDSARCAFLDLVDDKLGVKNTALLSLKAGELYLMKFPVGLGTDRLEITRAGSTVLASKIVTVNESLFLLASWLSDTVLVECRRESATNPAIKEVEDINDENADQDEDWIFRSSTVAGREGHSESKWNLRVTDVIPGFGPASDIAIGRQPYMESNNALDLVVAGGKEKNGCLAVLRRNVRPGVLQPFDVTGCVRVFAAVDVAVTAADQMAYESRRRLMLQKNEERKKYNEEVARKRQAWIAEEEERIASQSKSDDAAAPTDESSMRQQELETKAAEQFPDQPLEREEDPIDSPERLHSYLFLSTDKSTLVSSSGYDIRELEVGHDLVVDSPTFAAGNLLGNRCIVQVYKEGVRLFRGTRRLHEHALPFTSTIKAAQICDPYILVLFTSGSFLLLEAKVTGSDEVETEEVNETDPYDASMDELGLGTRKRKETVVRAELALVMDSSKSESKSLNQVSAAYLCGGRFGPLTLQSNETFLSEISNGLLGPSKDTEVWEDMDDEERMLYGDSGPKKPSRDNLDANGSASKSNKDDLDDEEMMLYADANDDAMGTKDSENQDQTKSGQTSSTEYLQESYILGIIHKNGTLQLRSVPDCERILFNSDTFYFGPRVIEDVPRKAQEEAEKEEATFEDSSTERIAGIALCPLRPGLKDASFMSASLALLALAADGSTLLYRSFYDLDRDKDGRAMFRLKFGRVCQEEAPDWGKTEGLSGPVQLLEYKDLQSRSGFIVSGKKPLLLTMLKSYPRLHPLVFEDSTEPSSLVHFSEFHNVNCQKGCIFVFEGGRIAIAEMPRKGVTSLESQWTMQKIPTRATVHKISYHSSSDTYGVLVAKTEEGDRDVTQRKLQEWSGKAEFRPTHLKADSARMPPLREERHQLRLYRPGTWTLIKDFDLLFSEVGLAICSVPVDVYKQPSGELSEDQKRRQERGEEISISSFASNVKLRAKHMLVVGTGHMRGEDATCRGRLIMFEVSKQQMDSFTSYQMQLIAEKELKGPASTISAMQGYVAVGVGPKVELYKLVEDEIVCTCFFFAELYCSSISTVKQYLFVGDMQKSTSLVYWRDRNKSMTLLGKDFEHASVYATEFLVDGEDLGLLFADSNGNLQVLNYGGVADPEARGGERLVPLGAFNICARVNKFARVSETAGNTRQVTMFLTLDGAVYGVVPVAGRRLRKMRAVQAKLVGLEELPRYAGLNPTASRARTVVPFGPGCYRPSGAGKVLTDGALLGDFRALTSARQTEVARQVGMDAAEIAGEILGLDRVIARF